MRWFKADSAGGSPALPGAPSVGIDDIRDRMLAFAAAAGTDRYPEVARRIRCAPDVETLCVLRGDLMVLLAGRQGELAARRSVATRGALFEQLLPQSLHSRPSRLNPRPTP